MAARVLITVPKKLGYGISIPTSYRSTSLMNLLGGILNTTFYGSTSSYRHFCRTSSGSTLYSTKYPGAPKSPIVPTWKVGNFLSHPRAYPEIFDKIRDESLQAICCFHGRQNHEQMHAYVIIQKLLEQYPHVHVFHFLIGVDKETGTYDEISLNKCNISSLPRFHFYQNGKMVVDLDGNFISRFKKVLAKLYKTCDSESIQNYYGVSTFAKKQATRQSSNRLFSTSASTFEPNQQSYGDSAFDKIRGRASFELILPEEYILGDSILLNVNMPAVLCFATYLEFDSYFIYALLHDTFSERFPHVPIYYVLLDPKEDEYDGKKMKHLDISSDVSEPVVHFFKGGRRIAVVATRVFDIDGYCNSMEKMFELYYRGEVGNNDREKVESLRRKIVKDIDYSTHASLEDIIKGVGTVYLSELQVNTPNEGNKFLKLCKRISDPFRKLFHQN